MLHELFRPASERGATAPGAGGNEAWSATIASVDETGVEVVIPRFDSTRRWGPCPYPPRVEVDQSWQEGESPHAHPVLALREPERGDRALVVFDENRKPWVVMWWPA